ncbi:MAG TPA: hypothetical protein VMW87_06020 [Spirochaetia bacterium]|nr:hypothetical protein [Spirochaetia bacterium]
MSHKFEIIYMFLYDVGRSVDLEQTRVLIPASLDRRSITSRDTPASLSVPQPLQLEVARFQFSGGKPFEEIRLAAKIYEDGVISMQARATVHTEIESIHRIRGMEFPVPSAPGDPGAEKLTTVGRWVHENFLSLFERIRPSITVAEYGSETAQRETYAAFCLLDDVPDVDRFLETHAQYLSTFLLGENPDIKLHASQVATTLDHRFSFKNNDLLILDLDRCFILDPDRDYEDILLILELANYQLVELRTLDRLLDRWLDQMETDIRRVYFKRSHRLRSLTQRLARLIPLRLDALFILENLENTSKIIGDYYLGQVYEHLCTLMGTGSWERSVRRRLETLQEVYSMAKVDVNERLLLIMEILVVLLIGFEIVALLFPLLPHG